MNNWNLIRIYSLPLYLTMCTVYHAMCQFMMSIWPWDNKNSYHTYIFKRTIKELQLINLASSDEIGIKKTKLKSKRYFFSHYSKVCKLSSIAECEPLIRRYRWLFVYNFGLNCIDPLSCNLSATKLALNTEQYTW